MELQQAIGTAQDALDGAENLLQKHLKLIKEISSRVRNVKDLGTNLKELQIREGSLTEYVAELKGEENNEQIEDLEKRVKELQRKLNSMKPRLRSAQRQAPNYFMLFLIGNVDLTFWSEEQKVRFRAEYIRFKELGIYIYLAFPLLHFLFGLSEFVVSLQHFWYMFYYITLTIRENILWVNGSKIRRWWINHHLISILISMTAVISQDGTYTESYPMLSSLVNFFLFFQGAVMWFQAEYQKKRFYTRVAMGKAQAMDLPATEVIDEKITNVSLQSLVMASWGVYAVESLLGLCFFLVGVREDYGLHKAMFLIQGMCFMVLAAGNAQCMYSTMKAKETKKKN